MKKRLFIIHLIFLLTYPAFHVIAQDTISTAGVEFINAIPASAANKNVLKKTDISDKSERNAATRLDENTKPVSLWAIFIAGLLGGFAALLMPCIFPMLPMTVSFFTKGSSEKNKGVGQAVVYGISIIIIYVVLGLAITVCFGADALNSLSTNGIFNFVFFLLILFFAASFLGAFEIALPGSWVNKMDKQSERKGIIGLFFMAATLALVSFSCTGPIVGTLLVQAATTGALLGPAIGMFGFALALAIPFTLFALFPAWMSALPKSGGWLNSVKVTLGFLELAFSLKFLSNVDLAYHWHLFDREIFLVLWIVIFALLGLYLLGKLTLSHDSRLIHISVPRLFLAIIVSAFSLYMIPGLWGAPLKSISAFLPPMSTQDFDLSATSSGFDYVPDASNNQLRKYAALFDKPKGFNPFFDYDEALAYAKKVNKPLMIDFTGHACVNCRKMEANIWPVKDVSKRINRDYVLVQLYVDDKTDLAPNEQTVKPEGRAIKTIGNKWSYLQTDKFQANSQPFYVLLDPKTEQPLIAPQGADYEPSEFAEYLEKGLRVFASK